MSREETRATEKDIIRKALDNHPAVLLQGSNEMAVRQAKSTILERLQAIPLDRELLRTGTHPDVHEYDGRETTTETARAIRDRLTALPARWPFRYLILTHADSMHHAAVQTLLKLIEEPPAHLKIVITTDDSDRLPGPVLSRTVYYPIVDPNKGEIEVILKEDGVPEPAWRALAGAGDLAIARHLDQVITKDWHKFWEMVRAGMQPSTELLYKWDSRLQETTVPTKVACWHLLVGIAGNKPENKYWTAIAMEAIEARSRAQRKQGGDNWVKMHNYTSLLKVYLWAQAAVKR